MNGRLRDIAIAVYFGALFAMVAILIVKVNKAIDGAHRVDHPPIVVSTPVPNPMTGTNSNCTFTQDPEEDIDHFFDRVIQRTTQFADKLAKGK